MSEKAQFGPTANGPIAMTRQLLSRLAQIFAVVDAALRHLPFQPGQDDLGTIAAEAAADQHPALRVEQRDADIETIGLVEGHGLSLV